MTAVGRGAILSRVADPAEELEQRNRFGLGALIVGVACFIGGIFGSYSAGGATPTDSMTWLSAFNLLSLLVAPLSCALAAANLTSSDHPGARCFKGLLVFVIVLVAMLFFGWKAWFAGGGRIHM